MYIIKLKKMSDPTPQLSKLETFAANNVAEYPKLLSSVKELRKFVGANEVKETVAKSVQFVLAHQIAQKPIRKSTRKRKAPGRLVLAGREPSKRVRSNTEASIDSDYEEEQEEQEEEEEWESPKETQDVNAFKAILAAALLQHGMNDDEDDSDYEAEEGRQLRYKTPEYLKGVFQHTMLLGKPGTGKTTFAHILVNIWDAIKIVDKKRFFITSRGDWVGKYQGHSVAKAKKIISKARGGVIFIDEAYSLIAAKDGEDTYGHEVLTEIVEAMSNDDKNVTFIFAGYENDMKRLFQANKGLSRRFGYIFKFSQPNPLHLFLIFQKQLKETKWKIPKSERQKAVSFFSSNTTNYLNGVVAQLFLLYNMPNKLLSHVISQTCMRKSYICVI